MITFYNTNNQHIDFRPVRIEKDKNYKETKLTVRENLYFYLKVFLF